jgi:hypothetical protein
MPLDKYLIFLCHRAEKAGPKNLSYRIAIQLEQMGMGEIGKLQDLAEQHALAFDEQKKMLFINDCRSGCVRVLAHRFHTDKYFIFDVSSFTASVAFDISRFIHADIIPKLERKWNSGLMSKA